MKWRIGIDVGGTFSDLFAVCEESGECRLHKHPSSVEDPSKGIRSMLAELRIQGQDITEVAHGTTVLTNVLLEEKGSRVGYATNLGFRDIPFIQYGNKEKIYDLAWVKPKPLISRSDCFELPCRIGSKGEEIRPLSRDDVERCLKAFREKGIRSIAVCFLFSFINPAHELLFRKVAEEVYPEATVSLSHEVYRRWKEHERSSTTIADAYVRNIFESYIENLSRGFREIGTGAPLFIMKCNGGVMDFGAAKEQPIQCLSSGTVAGVLAGRQFCELAKADAVITMDVGGTSCDVSMIVGGKFGFSASNQVRWGNPVCTPMVDVRSIGAGGGSVAWVDKGGLLRVGPQSAGARPGPACYGLGGMHPTVTDANLYLGRINPRNFCGGKIILVHEKAEAAISSLASGLGMSVLRTAEAVVEIANHNISNAIRIISIERGIDPREFMLLAFGGAGGLHAVRVAEIMGLNSVLIPVNPGHASAFGLLNADLRTDAWVTLLMRSDQLDLERLNSIMRDITESVQRRLMREGSREAERISYSLEMQYFGQSHSKEVDFHPEKSVLTEQEMRKAFEDFHLVHKEKYGYYSRDDVVEIVGIRAAAISIRPKVNIAPRRHGDLKSSGKRQVCFLSNEGPIPCLIYNREDLPGEVYGEGPAVIEEAFSTTLIARGQGFSTDQYGNLSIRLNCGKEQSHGKMS